ncbi:MAG TPA: 4Fe-4S dicluster domain-containing protein [Terriglobales bacterium]|nr:4Fe-4S dicluster domain-containing protein [Terriglobales bacterium]
MSDRKMLQIQRISGHPGPVPGKGTQRQQTLCKLVDTTTCIGCKACEVACVEWNDMPFQPTMFDNTYQTMPDTHWNYWNLIKFDEVSNNDGTFQWLMRKHQCMHCADPGCLAACPADGAIVQYENGIVDFQQEIASAVSSALRVVRLTCRNSIRRQRRFTSARCVQTVSDKALSLPASRPVRQAACTLAPKMTCWCWRTTG